MYVDDSILNISKHFAAIFYINMIRFRDENSHKHNHFSLLSLDQYQQLSGSFCGIDELYFFFEILTKTASWMITNHIPTSF